MRGFAIPGRARRRALTLVELLVVIAIIAILVAILVPAVMKVRALGYRADCGNNLKQIGLALHAHHDARKTLPPGAMQTGGVDAPCHTNWAIEILPYLEQRQLYLQYQQQQVNTSTANNRVGQERVPVFECPADVNIGRLERPASGPGSSQQWMHGSYRGNAGRANDIAQVFSGNAPYLGFWDSFQPCYWPNGGRLNVAYRGPLHANASCYNGVGAPTYIDPKTGKSIAQLGGPERFADVSDGLSNTFLVGEYGFATVGTEHNGGVSGTFWAYSTAPYSLSSFSSPLQATFAADLNTCLSRHGDDCNAGNGAPCHRGWGSNHASGANFLMCDGSVRWLGYATDIRILAALGTMAGEIDVVCD